MSQLQDPSIENLRNNERLLSFLDDANATVLSASAEKLGNSENSVKIHIDNATTNVGKTNDKVLVLFKSKPEVITPENQHAIVLVNSMLNSPVNSLYHALQKIYSPLLLKVCIKLGPNHFLLLLWQIFFKTLPEFLHLIEHFLQGNVPLRCPLNTKSAFNSSK